MALPYGNSWGNPTPNVVFGRGDYRALMAELYAANVAEFALDCATTCATSTAWSTCPTTSGSPSA